MNALRRILSTILLALGLARALAAAAAPPTSSTHAAQPGLFDKLFHHLESVASPGPLSAAHAALDNPEGCGKCHQGARGLSNDFCLDCHKEVAGRQAANTGLHGSFKGECFECHKEHQGRDYRQIQLDEKKFDHAKTRYPLQGAHRRPACASCHTNRTDRQVHYLIGLPAACTACHTNPHAAQFKKRTCTDCHNEIGFQRPNLQFNHVTMTSYTLTGEHQEVACERCHAGMAKFRISTACASCHADPHQSQFGARTACQNCHQTSGWKSTSRAFRHDTMTHYQLLGKHQSAACSACHKNGKYVGTPTSCAACHRDPHQGQFGAAADCQACHQLTGWTGKDNTFQHASTRFPLADRHARAACARCHQEGQYRGTPTTCAACHRSPHREDMKDCGACHTVESFGRRANKFDHDRQTRFPLTGLHAAPNCSECHAGKSFRSRGATCVSCHADVEDFYAGKLFSKIAPDKPDAMHGVVKCEDCHHVTDTKAGPAPIRPRCIACHNPQYGAYFDESRQVLAAKLKSLPPSIAHDPEKKRAAETIARLGPHNVIYANKLLDRLRNP